MLSKLFMILIAEFLYLCAGTGTAAEKYKCGKKTTDITLEILNLDKKEFITIDITSNQEFTEVFSLLSRNMIRLRMLYT